MTGLVLEGGGMRGVFTAGVLDFLLEQNIEFDKVAGVSAGACHACSYLSKQKGRAYRACADYIHRWEYMSFRSLIKTGNLFGEKFVYHEIPEKLIPIDNDEFLKSGADFRAVVTNCKTGKAEYLRVRDVIKDVEMVRASSSLPLVSRMVEINGKLYLDGGIADSVPLKFVMDEGCEKNLVVLTRPRDYVKDVERFQFMIRRKYKKFPQMIETIKNRHTIYNEQMEFIRQQEAEGKAFVIAPRSPLDIGRTERDTAKLKAAYDIGYALALEKKEELFSYFG